MYGDDAFIMRQPIFWSDINARIKYKESGMKDLEERAKAYAKVCMLGQPCMRHMRA